MMRSCTFRSTTTVALFLLTASGFSRTATAQDQTGDLDPRIVKLVASISDERLGAILNKLGSFETRNTLSSTDSSTRGIGAARQWIFDEMKSYSPKLRSASIPITWRSRGGSRTMSSCGRGGRSSRAALPDEYTSAGTAVRSRA